MSKSVIVSVIAALLVGGGLGTAAATPEVVTKEVTKEVPVEKIVTEEVEVEVEVAPQSCLDAIEHAETFAGSAADFAGVAALWPNLVIRAARAGMNVDATALDGVTADMEDATSEVLVLSGEIRIAVRQFNRSKAACQASA